MNARTAPDSLAVSPGMLSATLDLRRTTVLANSTDVDAIPDSGRIKVVWLTPRPSSGEQLVWQVMCWLSAQADLPTMDDLRDGLDAENFAAVAAVLAAEGVRV